MKFISLKKIDSSTNTLVKVFVQMSTIAYIEKESSSTTIVYFNADIKPIIVNNDYQLILRFLRGD